MWYWVLVSIIAFRVDYLSYIWYWNDKYVIGVTWSLVRISKEIIAKLQMWRDIQFHDWQLNVERSRTINIAHDGCLHLPET